MSGSKRARVDYTCSSIHFTFRVFGFTESAKCVASRIPLVISLFIECSPMPSSSPSHSIKRMEHTSKKRRANVGCFITIQSNEVLLICQRLGMMKA
jgi:hypothetical protein